ncbi:hypothetical protein LC087_15710 [Bacillus carboniphilus]|uniref:Uncharacterized protein n=1 Tax=Bacillus carboniphilus TaxID=86663 RepID=A0ABY9JV58_9BACI|nr:hypothetical protein [Bacillus carboniphilus]WLR42168.1 hypothetical protein LC087_15710 [Bacillus carboniphilus]
MAKKKLNPIHGADLAEYCVREMSNESNRELEIGGPTVFKHQDIAELAFQLLDKKPKFFHIPPFLLLLSLRVVKIFNKKYYDIGMFFHDGMTQNMIAPTYGSRNISSFFNEYLDAQQGDGK